MTNKLNPLRSNELLGGVPCDKSPRTATSGASLSDFVDDDGDYRYRHEPDDLNQCDCGGTLNVYGVCPACQM